MKRMQPKSLGAACLGLLLAFLATGANAASGTAKALITWDGEGNIYQVGTGTLLFLGAFEGIIYVETEDKAMDEGFVRCPATVRMDIAAKTASSSGYCEIAVDAGDTVYAEWSCEGQPGACEGTFKLVEGTGRFKGITGSSPMRMRSPLGSLAVDMASGSIVRAASGIAILSKLEYNNPAK